MAGVDPMVCDEYDCDAEIATRIECCDLYLCLQHIVAHNVAEHRYHDERRRLQRRSEPRGGRRASDRVAVYADEFATAI
ncbi:MAG: hypothetical protein ABR520_06130 [Mycobacteriales bacterium]|nr:hypothetical protein [Frankia sp.]